MLRETDVVALALFSSFLLGICAAKGNQTCRPSSCGEIRNISYPFRLESDPSGCGDPDYELVCENNHTVVYLPNPRYHNNGWRYYVAHINYNRSTIRVVDPGVLGMGNCFSTSLHSLILPNNSPYVLNWLDRVPNVTVLMKCEQPISDSNYIPINSCNSTNLTSSSSSSSQPQPYAYALVGGGDSMVVGDIKYDSCTMGRTVMIHKFLKAPGNLSMSDLQEAMLLGYELSFLGFRCKSECEVKGLYCGVDYGNYTISCFKGMSLFCLLITS